MEPWEDRLVRPSTASEDPRRPAGERPASGQTFTPRKARRTLDELIVSASVRERLDQALARFEHHDLLYRQWNLGRIDPARTGMALNFYGRPGTGKSMAAEAVAAARGASVIDVDYAEIESKYVGETPKNIEACFRAAAKSGAVLVFNEADSILGARLSQVTQAADHAVNASRAVMLKQLDEFQGLVVFTTNYPGNYDAAFVRRIMMHVCFDPPDEPTLRRLWEHLVPAEVPRAEQLDLDQLAAGSLGLAGGDLVNAVWGAALRAVRRDGAQRALRNEDLLAEVAEVRRNLAEVGKSPEPSDGRSAAPPRVVSVEPLEKLPPDAVGAAAAAGAPE